MQQNKQKDSNLESLHSFLLSYDQHIGSLEKKLGSEFLSLVKEANALCVKAKTFWPLKLRKKRRIVSAFLNIIVGILSGALANYTNLTFGDTLGKVLVILGYDATAIFDIALRWMDKRDNGERWSRTERILNYSAIFCDIAAVVICTTINAMSGSEMVYDTRGAIATIGVTVFLQNAFSGLISFFTYRDLKKLLDAFIGTDKEKIAKVDLYLESIAEFKIAARKLEIQIGQVQIPMSMDNMQIYYEFYSKCKAQKTFQLEQIDPFEYLLLAINQKVIEKKVEKDDKSRVNMQEVQFASPNKQTVAFGEMYKKHLQDTWTIKQQLFNFGELLNQQLPINNGKEQQQILIQKYNNEKELQSSDNISICSEGLSTKQQIPQMLEKHSQFNKLKNNDTENQQQQQQQQSHFYDNFDKSPFIQEQKQKQQIQIHDKQELQKQSSQPNEKYIGKLIEKTQQDQQEEENKEYEENSNINNYDNKFN